MTIFVAEMKTVIDARFSGHADYIHQIPQLVETGEGEVIYQKRNVVVRFRHEGMVYVVKRFKRVNFIQQVVYTFFRRSKAERAYLFAEEYRRRGIETPLRVAYMEQRRWGLFSVGYFVSLEAPGTESHLLLREVQDFSHDLADAVVDQIVLMHSRGVLHGDLNLSNFLCSDKEGHYRFVMIDINRSHFCEGYPSDGKCLENLVRMTHRRDLYEYLVAQYARQRGWDERQTVAKASALLDRFENRVIKL